MTKRNEAVGKLSGRICIDGMRFYGKHGTSEEERAKTQPIDLDVEAAIDLGAAARSDRLSDTIDYTKLYALCERAVTQESFALLEALAGHIARQVLADDKVLGVVVRARKPRLLGGATPQVEIRMRRRNLAEGARE
jgi:dihydroneopterin aldolase